MNILCIYFTQMRNVRNSNLGRAICIPKYFPNIVYTYIYILNMSAVFFFSIYLITYTDYTFFPIHLCLLLSANYNYIIATLKIIYYISLSIYINIY